MISDNRRPAVAPEKKKKSIERKRELQKFPLPRKSNARSFLFNGI